MLRNLVYSGLCALVLALFTLAITSNGKDLAIIRSASSQEDFSSEDDLLGKFDKVIDLMSNVPLDNDYIELLILGTLVEIAYDDSTTTDIERSLWGAAFQATLCEPIFGSNSVKNGLCFDVMRANYIGGTALQAIYSDRELPLSIDQRVSELRTIVLTNAVRDLSDPTQFRELFADVEVPFITAFAQLDRSAQAKIISRLEKFSQVESHSDPQNSELLSNFREATKSLLRKLQPQLHHDARRTNVATLS